MEDKDKKEYEKEGYKFLSETHRGLMDKRQKYEWKFIYAILTFCVLAVYAFYKDTSLSSISPYWIILIEAFFVVLAVISWYYLLETHIANEKNKEIAEYNEKNIHYLMHKKAEKIEYKEIKEIIDNARIARWAFRCQIIAIILFVTVSGILIAFKILISTPHCVCSY